MKAFLCVFGAAWYARAQPGQNPVPCISDCLAEALSGDPTKGCPPGTYWLPFPRSNPTESCEPCPVGSYCPGVPYGNFTADPVNLNRRIQCPAGFFNNFTGASTLAECNGCLPGRYNTYIGTTQCTDCPSGTYSITEGSSSLIDCLVCPAGHHCHEACGRPIPCPAGTYVSFEGMENESFCLNCTKGHYCPIGSVGPVSCLPGSFGNDTGILSSGYYPGAFLPLDWTEPIVTGYNGTGCESCLEAHFCPSASAVPTQCPPGTTAPLETKAEEDCVSCPVGSRCQMLTSTDTLQTLVVREADGSPMGGSAYPEACTVDETVLHHDFPEVKGCVENCPYDLPRQSYCHVAGDGRVPDRTLMALQVASLINERQPGLRPTAARQAALVNLTVLLDNLTAANESTLPSLTMVDANGRTPLMMAAMMGDVELLDLLALHGAAGVNASTARDNGGFSAIMHALLLEQEDVVTWLIADGATLTEVDVVVLEGRGVDVSGVPPSPSEYLVAPAYLGRGSLSWTHPSGASFQDLPVENPLPTTTTTSEFSTITQTTSTATATVTVP